ncbi:hypothetical protein ACHAWF_016521 [Thalassiosira exigua]
MMVPPLSLLFLACDQGGIGGGCRRAFLGAACSSASAAAVALVGAPAASAVAEAETETGAGAASEGARELYLARPMGVSKEGEGGGAARPSAPIEYLLPAARVGVYVYETLAVAEELDRLLEKEENHSTPKVDATIQRLDDLLLAPPPFVKSDDPSVTRGDPYGALPLVGEVAAQQRKRRERKDQSVDPGIIPQLFEVGELAGERRQWNRLVRAERAREDASEVRRALNIYATNLNFDPNKYVYSGTKEEKSQRIREGRLPTATEVIRSDLDARDLYRNAVQTALEDARAEFVYQKRNGFEDPKELVALLRDARGAIDRWFGFVPDGDVQEALEAVERERRG